MSRASDEAARASHPAPYFTTSHETPGPWRETVAARRLNSVLSPDTFAAAAPTFVLHAGTIFLLTGAELYKLEQVCTKSIQIKPAATAFRECLWTNERRQVSWDVPVLHVYADYHVSRLQRLFLRAILRARAPLVCAGGFPAAAWCKFQGIRSWKPLDIDLFMFSDVDMDFATQLYEQIVAVNVGAEFDSTAWLNSNARDVPEVEGSADVVVRAVRRRITSKQQCRSENFLAAGHPWSSRDLHEVVENWTSTRDPKRFVRTYTDFSDCATCTGFRTFVRDLKETAQHLPSTLELPQTRVLYTKQLSLRKAGLVLATPKSLTKVNLIRLVSDAATPSTDTSTEFDLAKHVCQDFDINVCCVAIVSIDDDLKFNRGTFVSYRGAFQGLVGRVLRLGNSAFACQTNSVQWQMQRISKYLARSFTWDRARALETDI